MLSQLRFPSLPLHLATLSEAVIDRLMAAALLRTMLATAALALAGCSGPHAAAGYYWRAANGHFDVMRAARPVDDWIAADSTPEALRNRLRLAQRMRQFAVTDLGLPDNASYRRYADLHRPAVLWNVVSTPALSLTLRTWCVPVAGCIGYRGYFDRADADALAESLRADGNDVWVYGVPAYSTLGWSNWVGGDPLLNTFIGYAEGDLARLIFHELAHQVVYAPGDTTFNESFATAVERLGVARWMAANGDDGSRAAFGQAEARRAQFRALVLTTRARLQTIYASKPPLAQHSPGQAAMKKEAFDAFRADYVALRAQWPGNPAQFAGFDRWVAEANNASFAAQAAYDELVPGFEALFARDGNDWPTFFRSAQALADATQAQRRLVLLPAH